MKFLKSYDVIENYHNLTAFYHAFGPKKSLLQLLKDPTAVSTVSIVAFDLERER